MKILIDSGNNKNIGDNAMLLNILDNLIMKTDYSFYVIDRGVYINLKEYKYRVILTNNIFNLMKMPHWRVASYSRQPFLHKYFYGFIFWSISISRALKILIGVSIYKRFKFNLFRAKIFKYWVELLCCMDGYWVVGGGNINDFWIEQAFWKMIFAWSFKYQGKPVIFSGQGIGPINRFASKIITFFGLPSVSLLALREELSLNNLRKVGRINKNTFVVGDDALCISEKEMGQMESLPRKFFALNVRFSKYALSSSELVGKYSRLVVSLMDRHRDLFFIFIPISFNNNISDIKSAQEVFTEIKNKNRIGIFPLESVNPYTIKLILKNAQFSLGTAYHFCLFSLSVGVPTVGLYANGYYEQKLGGLMRMFNLSNSTFDLRGVNNIDDLSNKVEFSFRRFNKHTVLAARIQMEKNWDNFVSLAIRELATKVV